MALTDKKNIWKIISVFLILIILLYLISNIASYKNEAEQYNLGLKELRDEVRKNSVATKDIGVILNQIIETASSIKETVNKVHGGATKAELKRPRRVHTVPAPPESKAICKSVFPSKSVVPAYGCGISANSNPKLSFNCYEPIVLSCEDLLEDARDKYYRHVMRNHCNCSEFKRFGRVKDGGWELCLVGPYQPEQNKCLIYSVGIRNDWSFDEAISTQYGCSVMSFDPSIGKDDHKHSERVWFYNIGLGGKDEEHNKKGWKMRTLASLIKQLGHVNKTIDMVKFDVEFSEWASIAAMLKENALVHVKQIAFEIHTWRDTKEDYLYFWQQLQSLENAGFQRWRHQHLNWRCFYPDGIKQYCPQVNMNYINTNLIHS